MHMKLKDGTDHSFSVGAIYHDQLVRTAEGWRIAERREEQILMEGSLPG